MICCRISAGAATGGQERDCHSDNPNRERAEGLHRECEKREQISVPVCPAPSGRDELRVWQPIAALLTRTRGFEHGLPPPHQTPSRLITVQNQTPDFIVLGELKVFGLDQLYELLH